MDHRSRLINRLNQIGAALKERGDALALLALGSAGRELDRLDAYSDLDFFAIVRPGCKPAYLADLDWLSSGAAVAYAFPNTVDGYKLLYADGIFAEMAVFEPGELAGIPFATGRVVWHAADFDPALAEPRHGAAPEVRTTEWLLGEALTNLYVGLQRHCRGEKLSASRFIQSYAVDRVLELASQVEAPRPAYPDRFAPERRCEQRLPGLAAELPAFVQGYNGNVASARAILAFLERHFAVNAAMRAAILDLCKGAEPCPCTAA